MNGFKAYKYYMAVKLHFTTDKFNVFENGGAVKGSIAAFKDRQDRFQFEQLAQKIIKDNHLIQYYVANFAYGYPHAIWVQEEGFENYRTWQKRKESISYTVKKDLDAIFLHCVKEGIDTKKLYSFNDGSYPELLKLYMGNHITFETMRILDDYVGYLDEWKEEDSLALLWNDEMRRIKKAKGFVKYDAKRIDTVYNTFKEELTSLYHGQDSQTPEALLG